MQKYTPEYIEAKKLKEKESNATHQRMNHMRNLGICKDGFQNYLNSTMKYIDGGSMKG